jgi:hypothetical protein
LNQIQLATKCNLRPESLKQFVQLASSLDISAIEIHELFSIMRERPLIERVESAAAIMKGKIDRLAFHQPLESPANSWEQTVKVLKFDLAFEDNAFALGLARETIIEAITLGLRLGLEKTVCINFHLEGLVCNHDVSLENKLRCLLRGEEALRQLRRFTEAYCFDSGFTKNGQPQAVLVHENTFSFRSNEVFALLSVHPEEITRLLGIGVNIDFAHLQIAINYLNANPGSESAKIENKLYPPLDWETTIETVKDRLELLHLNDAKGWTIEGEGLEIGLGEISYETIIPLICCSINKEVMGTIEVKTQHLHPEQFTNSVRYLRSLFKENFSEYFC